MQLKDIQRQSETFNHLNIVKQIKPEIPIYNNQFNNIVKSIDINETDYEEMWENRIDYWKNKLKPLDLEFD